MFLPGRTLLLALSLVLCALHWQQVRGKSIFVDQSCVVSQCRNSTTIPEPCCPNLKLAVSLAQSNDSIFLAPGTYSGTANRGICELTMIESTCAFERVSLVGLERGRVFIEGTRETNDTRALVVNHWAFSLIANITFRNFHLGGVSAGGVVSVDETPSLLLQHVSFEDNANTGAGALTVSRSQVALEDCLFRKNQATSSGGAISSAGSNLTISRTEFVSNNATSLDDEMSAAGGAIAFRAQSGEETISITDSLFQGNAAQRTGGALVVESKAISVGMAKVYISRCSFLENTGTGRGTCASTSSCNSLGGAIYVNTAKVTIEDSVFRANAVQSTDNFNIGQGGAIFLSNVLGTARDGSARINRCNFTRNSAVGLGGAIAVLNQRFHLADSIFVNNRVSTSSPYFDDTPAQGGAIWFSAQNQDGKITGSTFLNNTVLSGWGGGVYLTGTARLKVFNSTFNYNGAVSSYTNSGQGGAIMSSYGTSLSVYSSMFRGNAVYPKMRLTPQTYSGEGGAIFAQSSALHIEDCQFILNYALTGQFDAGSYGGAIILENCYPAEITRSFFRGNGAIGYFGKSSYASSGTGGGIYVKFSAANISGSHFEQNWASAGGSQNSFGGAIAVNFDYSSVSGSMHGVSITNTTFHNNTALSQLCYNVQAGEGAALGVLGAKMPALTLEGVNFTANHAQSSQSSLAFSNGGAITMSQASNVSATSCRFEDNAAFFGIGNDIASLAGENDEDNTLLLEDCFFHAASGAELNAFYSTFLDIANAFCAKVEECISKEDDTCSFTAGGFETEITERKKNARRLQEREGEEKMNYISLPSFPGLHWLRISKERADSHALAFTLFDRYALPLRIEASLTHTQEEYDKEVLRSVLVALRTFASSTSSTPTLSATEKKTLSLLIEELEKIPQTKNASSEEENEEEEERLFYSEQLERSHERRRLQTSRPSEADVSSFTTYRPDAVLASGLTLFVNPKFDGDYYVFSGDYDELSASRTSSGIEFDPSPGYSFYSEVRFFGEIASDGLTLTIASSSAYINMPLTTSNSMTMKQLNIFNGTLTLANNLRVLQNSYLFESHVVGIPSLSPNYYLVPFPHLHPHNGGRINFRSSFSEHALSTQAQLESEANATREFIAANLTFARSLFTGYEMQQLSGRKNFLKRTFVYYLKNISLFNASNYAQQTVLRFEGVALVIEGEMFLDSPFRSIFVSNLSRSVPDSLYSPSSYSSNSYSSAVPLAFHTNTKMSYDKAVPHTHTHSLSTDSLSASPIPAANTYPPATLNDLLSAEDTEYLFNAKLLLSKNATIIVTEQGSLSLVTASSIESVEDDSANDKNNTDRNSSVCSNPVLINYGNVSLSGVAGSFFSQEMKIPTPQRALRVASLGSLTTSLSVPCGEMLQYETGRINVMLNSSSQTRAVLFLRSNAYLSGSLAVDFFQPATVYEDDTLLSSGAASVAELSLYAERGAPVSAFAVLQFANYSLSVEDSLDGLPPMNIAAPEGLRFLSAIQEKTYKPTTSSLASVLEKKVGVLRKESSLTDTRPQSLTASSNDSSPTHLPQYSQTLTIANIGCAHIPEYYAGYTSLSSTQAYQCFVCLSNSSCELCGGGVCALKGQCGARGVAFSDTCCHSSCHSPYGSCELQGDFSSYQCVCNWFYDGDNCQDISTNGFITIFSGLFVVVVCVLSLCLYRRVMMQRKKVLEELKEGILRHTESHNNEYIQTMQQALILNDVFVKWDEIKIESQIGEGSFGVVHKATFRGAQVAVKQMRSMFLELTEKDIEEFRKEAYMMSRLRHPNIVLVMGISLVDQEPVALPHAKTRSLKRLSPSDEAEISPFLDKEGNSGKKKVLQKTVCIITEYLEQGSLADILYGPTRLPAEIWTYELILTCALQAARGMLYLHSHHPPICHRDLKSSNLVVDDHWVVKVTDFGMSRIVPEKLQEAEQQGELGNQSSILSATSAALSAAMDDRERDRDADERDLLYERASTSSFSSYPYGYHNHNLNGSGYGLNSSNHSTMRLSISALSSQNPVALEMTSNLGTTAWCAPELLTASSKTKYSVKVDVYSYGMVLWELWEKKRPFEEFSSRFDIMDAVRSGKRPAISDSCPPTFRSLITRCWHTEPSRRPTFNYIVRYLKDELARVKRNKTLSAQTQQGQSLVAPIATANTTVNTNANTGNTTSRQSLMSAYFRPSFSAVQQSLAGAADLAPMAGTQRSATQNTQTGNSNEKKATRRSSGTTAVLTSSLSGSNLAALNTQTQQATGSNSNANSNSARNPLHSPRTEKTSDASPHSPHAPSAEVPIPLPQSRTPLVKAVDRSLSYLAQSPAVGGPFIGSHSTQSAQSAHSAQSTHSAQGGVASAAAAASATAPQGALPGALPQGAKYNASQAWRDRYVMRFSGWKSSNPDAGLPPPRSSLTGTHTQTTSRPASSAFAPVSSTVGANNNAVSGVSDVVVPPLVLPESVSSEREIPIHNSNNPHSVGSSMSMSPSRAQLGLSLPTTNTQSHASSLATSSLDSLPMFPLEQDPLAQSLTMREARVRRAELADEEQAENASM